MDSEKLLKQGMEMAEKLRDTAGEQAERHEDRIKDALGKVTGFVNEKTGGKYSDQVSKAASFLERGVEMLAAQSPRSETSGPGASGPAAAGAESSASGATGSVAGSSGPAGDPGGPTPPPAGRPDEPSAG